MTATGRSTGCSTSPSSRRLNLRVAIEKWRGSVDEALLGRLGNSAHDRNWDSIKALWELKEGVKADAELAKSFRSKTAVEILGALRGSPHGPCFLAQSP